MLSTQRAIAAGLARDPMNDELLLDFFVTFSKFEFALKASGMFVQSPDIPGDAPDAKPDWDTFAGTLQAFMRDRSDDLRAACEYLADSPPHKQVILGGAVAWETRGRAQGESEVRFLLRMVRGVRNNLFHGGKHNIGLHESPERTERLLRSSLIILRECLRLAPVQRQAFEQAVL